MRTNNEFRNLRLNHEAGLTPLAAALGMDVDQVFDLDAGGSPVTPEILSTLESVLPLRKPFKRPAEIHTLFTDPDNLIILACHGELSKARVAYELKQLPVGTKAVSVRMTYCPQDGQYLVTQRQQLPLSRLRETALRILEQAGAPLTLSNLRAHGMRIQPELLETVMNGLVKDDLVDLDFEDGETTYEYQQP